MVTKDLLRLSTRMFTARRGRTILTILGMGIGFGVILFLVSLGYGLQDALLENITTAGALTALDVTPNEQEGKILTPAAVEEIKKIDGVKNVEASYNFGARMKFGDTASDTRAVIASPAFLELDGLKITTGKPLAKDNPKEIVVSSAFVKMSEKRPEELVGQKASFSIFIPDQTAVEISDYTIAGITESEETVFYIPWQENLNIPPTAPFSKLKAGCRSSDIMNSVKDAISSKGFSVSSLSETVSEVNKLFRVLNIILGLFGIITLVVSAIGMFNTMTVALLERTREIGIMRSIGASKTDILLMFVIESTLMGFCGGIVGLLIGVVSGQVVNLIFNAAAGYFGGKTIILFAYPLWFLGALLAFSILIGFATGIGPAKRASGLDPLEALKSR